jgi:Ca-activated chloride channel family protein
MGAKLGMSRQAVVQFLKTANPEDEFFLGEFNDRADMTATFAAFPEEIQSRLTFTQAHGSTAPLDGSLPGNESDGREPTTLAKRFS